MNTNKIIKFLFLNTALVTVIVGLGIYSFAADQRITITRSNADQAVGTQFILTVGYDVSNDDNTLSSLGVRIHFDSTSLDYIGFDEFFTFGKLADPQLQDDSANYDNDGDTDKFVLLTYSRPFDVDWPNEPLPLDLVKLLFTVKDDALAGPTHVNVSRVTSHTGYGFSWTSERISVTLAN